MIHETKNIKDDKGDFLEGLRVKNKSVKVFKTTGNKFVIVVKKYLWGIPIREEKIIVDNYEIAEEYMEDLRFEKNKRG